MTNLKLVLCLELLILLDLAFFFFCSSEFVCSCIKFKSLYRFVSDSWLNWVIWALNTCLKVLARGTNDATKRVSRRKTCSWAQSRPSLLSRSVSLRFLPAKLPVSLCPCRMRSPRSSSSVQLCSRKLCSCLPSWRSMTGTFFLLSLPSSPATSSSLARWG